MNFPKKMPNIKKRLAALSMAAMLAVPMLATSAFALEYTYESDAPGQTFYQSTAADANHIADSSQIVVGMDGTLGNNVTGNLSSSPLSALDLPVGEYPDAYGMTTDVAIAMNSVFPNEIGPTTQTTNIYKPTFLPTVVSGALPTGGNYAPAGMVVATGVGGVYGTTAVVPAGSSGLLSTAVNAGGGNGVYAGIATSLVSMPAITQGGAIGQLSIPSIGLSKYVYEGTSQSNMAKGLAHFDNTSGWLGNVAIAGHNRNNSNTAAFQKLKDVKVGDTVNYKTAYGTATYVVSDIRTVATTDTSGLLQDGTNKLTMYTCKANQPEVKLCVTATMVGTQA